MSIILRRWCSALFFLGLAAGSAPALAASDPTAGEDEERPAAEAGAAAPPAEEIALAAPHAEGSAPARGLAPPPDGDVSLVRALAPVDPAASSALAGLAGLTFSANAALVSEYRFRGVNLSGGGPALQGGVDVSHTSGFFAGTWASTLDNATVGYGDVELDLYGGWSGEVAEGLTATIGAIAYVFPDAPSGDFNYYEIYGSLGFILGPVSATVGAAYDPEQNGLNFRGLQRDNLYLYTNVSSPIPRTPFTVTAHLGYTDGAFSFEGASKSWDWSLEVSMPVWGPLSASLAYVDAAEDVANGTFNPTSSTVVAKLSARF